MENIHATCIALNNRGILLTEFAAIMPIASEHTFLCQATALQQQAGTDDDADVFSATIPLT